ncbi:hypothetical protein HAX54_038285, partial [Datura stramonium]|nr:hypothetical protein [Datura stramonium]
LEDLPVEPTDMKDGPLVLTTARTIPPVCESSNFQAMTKAMSLTIIVHFFVRLVAQ